MKHLGIAHSKHRNEFGLIGVELIDKTIHIRYCKTWNRNDINQIPIDIKKIKDQINPDQIYTDQQIGESLIKSIRNNGSQVRVVTTQKNLKDPKKVREIKVIDKTEIVQLTLTLFKNNQIIIPKNPTEDMTYFIDQCQSYIEKVTESGNPNYYAEGENTDSLVTALLIVISSLRRKLSNYIPLIVGQPIDNKPKTIYDSMRFINNLKYELRR